MNLKRGSILVESLIGFLLVIIFFYAMSHVLAVVKTSLDASSIWQDIIIQYHENPNQIIQKEII